MPPYSNSIELFSKVASYPTLMKLLINSKDSVFLSSVFRFLAFKIQIFLS